MHTPVVLCGFKRSPMHFANKGALAHVRPDDMAAKVISALLESKDRDPIVKEFVPVEPVVPPVAAPVVAPVVAPMVAPVWQPSLGQPFFPLGQDFWKLSLQPFLQHLCILSRFHPFRFFCSRLPNDLYTG